MDDPAGPPPMMATSKSGLVITNASSPYLRMVCAALNRGRLFECVYGHVTQQLVPGVLFVLLDLGHHIFHLLQYWRRGIVILVDLQQFQYIEAIAGVAH